MKIRLAILEKDENYLSRIVGTFNNRFSERLIIYSFTDLDTALESLEKEKIDIFIASEEYKIDTEVIPKDCGFAYFVESSSLESLYDQRIICKYQKAELIYKEILGIYAEISSSSKTHRIEQEGVSEVIVFMPVSGGVGCSTMAASCAIALARKGKKVLYLNLEQTGSSSLYFQAEGQFDLNDIIYSIKSRRSNLALKLESSVKKDTTGVAFYQTPKIALDIASLTEEDLQQLIQELAVASSYEYIIIDTDFSFDSRSMEIINQSRNVVLVSDGSEVANCKLQRTIEALKAMNENSNKAMLSKFMLLYNKFSSKTGKTIEVGLKSLGGAPRYEGATIKQLTDRLSTLRVFDGLI